MPLSFMPLTEEEQVGMCAPLYLTTRGVWLCDCVYSGEDAQMRTLR